MGTGFVVLATHDMTLLSEPGERLVARRKNGLLDGIAELPWPFGIVLGILAFVFISMVGGPFVTLAWIALVGCWIAAGMSYFKGNQRKRLLETQTGTDSLARMSWREFEMLVGEAYRRRGYFVEENGGGGKDGGIDLLLHKGGRTEIVQCKQWRNAKIRVSIVREMWGLAAHHNADAVKIVGIGDFTPDAAEFARGKPIELVNGEQLLELIREVQVTQPRARSKTALSPAQSTVTESPSCPQCPKCAGTMTQRPNGKTHQLFWGCDQYPRCRGTRSIS